MRLQERNSRFAAGSASSLCPREAVASTDGSSAEAEFFKAMQDYKDWSHRLFPTWSEVLEVAVSLGYEKVAQGQGNPEDRPASR